MARRLVAVPDTDEELVLLLGRLEEVLLALVPVESDDEPPPISLGAVAVAAVQNIRGAIVAAEHGPTAQLLGRGGTFELLPMRFVELDDVDLAALGAAVAALGMSLLPGGDEFTHELLAGFADDPARPSELVAGFARAHGLVDLAADADTWTVAGRIAGETGRVVLSAAEETAYQRVTDRALNMFFLNDPLVRFLYRGV
jgi:hypothetical protein